MKTTVSKDNSTPSQSSKPFFSKKGESGFFAQTKETEQPFFTPDISRQGGVVGGHNFANISIFPPRSQPSILPKLTINEPGDKYEQEADVMAERVMRMSAPVSAGADNGMLQTQPLNITSIQRKCADCEQEEKVQRQKMGDEESHQTQPLMRKAIDDGYTASPQLSSQLNSSKGGGGPLPGKTLASMNQAFGTDFSAVRIHTSSQAAEMSQGIQANAFTHGSDIYFNHGQYSPESSEGKRLLGHELTHVIQQKGDNMIQRSCSPAELTTLNTEMHGYCDQRRSCNMQTDTCATANAKISAGYGCIERRTLIQQKCFKPGDPGYHTHMQQIAQAYAALRYCETVARAKCNQREPEPVPVPVPSPQPQGQSTYEQIKEFARRVVEEGLDAEQAAEEFLRQNPGLVWTIIILGSIGIVALIADDLTLAGIADDVLIPIIGTLVRVAWRFA